MATRNQPLLPAEEALTQAERTFLEIQPPVFPPNQDSNWGLKRKVWGDQLQVLIDQQSAIFRERFVERAYQFLDEWESQVGIPSEPTLSDAARRLRILARLRNGPFTDQMRIQIVEPYVMATFGVSVELTPSGVSLAGGIPLYADASGDPRQYYRIYEDIQGFAYAVWIRNDVTPDVPNMLRDLKRITPAGITVTIDNTPTNVLNYSNTIRNDQPVGYWKMGSSGLTDSSGYGHNLIDPGGTSSPASVASPGLLSGSISGTGTASDFDGTNDYFTYSAAGALLAPNKYSIEAWVKLDTFPGSGLPRLLWARSLTGSTYLGMLTQSVGGGHNFRFSSTLGTQQNVSGSLVDPTQYILDATALQIVTGQVYHVVGVWDGEFQRLYVNGVEVANVNRGFLVPAFDATTSIIGAWNTTQYFWDGNIDEVAIYNYALSPGRIQAHYNAGYNIWS